MPMRLEDLKDDGCLYCGGEIDRSQLQSSKRTYCSAECRSAYHNRLQRDWRREDKAKLTRHCQKCGDPIPPSRRAEAIFCSRTCKHRVHGARSRQNLQRRTVENVPISCRWCGTMFTPKFGRTGLIFCSRACADAEARSRVVWTDRVCPICDTPFCERAVLPRRACSPACKRKLRLITLKANRAPITCEAVT